MPWAKYLKAAFVNQWNLLAFIGALGFAAISGHADVALPLVLAGEVAYLGFAGTHPKFQQYVDIHAAGERRSEQTKTSNAALQRILSVLPKPSMSRFESLRARCLELRQIASDLKHTGTDDAAPLDSLQVAGLDRLLWIFMRLLFTQHSISRFLERTSLQGIENDLAQVEERLQAVSPTDNSEHAQKVRRTLEDHRATCQERLENYKKAKANHELVGLEIDRLENKIKSLAELAVNRQEPEFISSQVDQVASSMRETEKTMNELDFATGLGPLEEEPPSLLRPAVQMVRS